MEKFTVAGFPFQVDKNLFQGDLDLAQQKAVFKQAVNRIVIETSSYCNRRCKFCPNVDGRRLGSEFLRKTMSSELLSGICDELAAIGYNKTILLHLYNEPTADPTLPEKVKLIRDKLPEAQISFNSNGDYLSREMLESLAEAGLSSMSVSLYGPNHGEYDTNYLGKSFNRVFEIVGQQGEVEQASDTELKSVLGFDYAGRRMPVTVFAVDFNKVGYDRAQSVGTEMDVLRTSPCPAPFAELNIAWDGLVVPCCNIHPDHAESSGQSCGKVERGEDIFRIFSSDRMRAWRRSTALYGQFDSPCDSCTRLNEPEVKDSSQARDHNRRMQLIMRD
jgi:MoaA/NifB/PqqE/SkfB family radical SAM enzyme